MRSKRFAALVQESLHLSHIRLGDVHVDDQSRRIQLIKRRSGQGLAHE